MSFLQLFLIQYVVSTTFFLQHVVRQLGFLQLGVRHRKGVDEKNCFQDDPILIDAIRNYYLDRPTENFAPVIPKSRLGREKLAVIFQNP
jgi:hypothetical protein